jgi:1,4-alpha-glucan branching enzyme
MLFMGEEFAASTPFLYFCDFDGELAAAVRRGRRNEFRAFAAFVDASARERIPDPNAEATFAASRLRWAVDGDAGQRRHTLVKHLLTLRRRLQPHLPAQQRGTLRCEGSACTSSGRWANRCAGRCAPVSALRQPRRSAGRREIYRSAQAPGSGATPVDRLLVTLRRRHAS